MLFRTLRCPLRVTVDSGHPDSHCQVILNAVKDLLFASLKPHILSV